MTAMTREFKLFYILGLLTIVGCSQGGQHQDLKSYIVETKDKPAGKIEEIPAFKPFQAFVYSAASVRSPFDRPLDIQQRIFAKSQKNIRPDLSRTKEYLESFDFNSLSMVGTLEQDGILWALIKDQAGGLHRVTVDNYVGKNHGRIIEATQTKIEVIEIVSDGLDGWLERPRVLALSEKD